ncbi:S-adenosylmethionine:tRNA ribosyltransferase-isomerase [Minicystis rosea]|nr:S-adenosylmethionine:tRNA ribosyltransferase-isomerase [Minicystis rosea]
MRRALFDYRLPPELIAAHPPAERDGARLLVLGGGAPEQTEVRAIERFIAPGTLLVVNDTRVIPARLLGHKVGTGGRVEIFLVRRLGEGEVADGDRTLRAERWSALGRSSKPLRRGSRIVVDAVSKQQYPRPPLCVEIISAGNAGMFEVDLFSPADLPIEQAIEACGHVPLPPYVHRKDDAADRERYQTVFARVPGAVAAPTAGLHLTTELLDRLRARGAEIASVTLHVGLGTFQPVTVDDLDDHPMHAEIFAVPAETVAAVARARDRGAPVLAIGTTAVRALESAADPDRPGLVRAMEGETRLLIQPGYRFRVVDQLLTNFHLPESTLLAMVSAFAGRERVLAAYQAAIDARYRFYSYGDAMLILSRADGGAV